MSAEGERCSLCGEPATRKVAEEFPYNDPPTWRSRHPATNYLCEKDFASIMYPSRAVAESSGTVRVRIAVAVDPTGHWSSAGWSRDDGSREEDGSLMDLAVDNVGQGESRCWVEADVPLPLVPQTIQGTVMEAS